MVTVQRLVFKGMGMTKPEIARQVLSDGRWHKVADLSTKTGVTKANIHGVLKRIKGIEISFKKEGRTIYKYARISNSDVVNLARQYPGIWGQLYWSTN